MVKVTEENAIVVLASVVVALGIASIGVAVLKSYPDLSPKTNWQWEDEWGNEKAPTSIDPATP